MLAQRRGHSTDDAGAEPAERTTDGKPSNARCFNIFPGRKRAGRAAPRRSQLAPRAQLPLRRRPAGPPPPLPAWSGAPPTPRHRPRAPRSPLASRTPSPRFAAADRVISPHRCATGSAAGALTSRSTTSSPSPPSSTARTTRASSGTKRTPAGSFPAATASSTCGSAAAAPGRGSPRCRSCTSRCGPFIFPVLQTRRSPLPVQ